MFLSIRKICLLGTHMANLLPLKNAFRAEFRHIPSLVPLKDTYKYVNLTYYMTSYGFMVMILLCRDFLLDRLQPAIFCEIVG